MYEQLLWFPQSPNQSVTGSVHCPYPTPHTSTTAGDDWQGMLVQLCIRQGLGASTVETWITLSVFPLLGLLAIGNVSTRSIFSWEVASSPCQRLLICFFIFLFSSFNFPYLAL